MASSLHYREPHLYPPRPHHIERSGGGPGEVDDHAAPKRPSIDHPHHHRLAALYILDEDLCAEGQRAVGAGEVVLVITLAARGLSAVHLIAVEGGLALFQEGGLARGGALWGRGACGGACGGAGGG